MRQTNIRGKEIVDYNMIFKNRESELDEQFKNLGGTILSDGTILINKEQKSIFVI